MKFAGGMFAVMPLVCCVPIYRYEVWEKCRATTTTDATTDATASGTTDEASGTTDEASEATTQSGECGNGVLEAGEECDAGGKQTAECEEDCRFAQCGDGLVNEQAGEACDAGGEQTAECEEDCRLAQCGDGLVNEQAGEECDAGEDNSDDAACTLGCKEARCGDGLLGPGEECDDGNEEDEDACSNDCYGRREVFLTGTLLTGNLGGLSGADAYCKGAGKAGKDYVAWLSAGGESARSRVGSEGYKGWYERVDGALVARGLEGLCSGGLTSAVVIDETGKAVNSAGVWTNTTPDGQTKGTDDCGGWTSDSDELQGHLGLAKPDVVDSRWTDNNESGKCNGGQRLYCVEVKP